MGYWTHVSNPVPALIHRPGKVIIEKQAIIKGVSWSA